MHCLPEMSKKSAVASAGSSPSFLLAPVLGKIVCRRQPLKVKGCLCDVESWNQRMVRVGRDLKDHLVPTPLP